MKKKISTIALIIFILFTILTIANLFYSFPSIKFSIVNKIIIVLFVLTLIIFLLNILKNKFFNKTYQIVISTIIYFILCFALIKGNQFLLNYNNLFSNMNSGDVYSTSLIARKDNAINSVEDINSNTYIGIQTIKSYENGTLALEELKKLNKTNNIKQYQDLANAFNDLKNNKISLMSVKSLDDKTLNSLDPNLKSNYKVIATFTTTQKATTTNKDISNTPFTMLIAGIDSRTDDIDDISRGDSNIIVSFNPITGRITTLTTPRDSYVTIACTGGKDKLTHAAAYGGTDCTKKTLENIYNIKIDYVLRINFVGVVEIVNSLGGIEVDVPINQVNANDPNVCEQDSHGVKGTICWVEGKVNQFNGEQALAFARNRYNQDGGDFYRGKNQQIIIEAILKKATKINNLDTINKLLQVASKHISTNLDKNDMTELYEIVLSMGTSLDIEKLYISGGTGMIGGASMTFPSDEDIAYASYRMKVNLNEEKPLFPQNGYYVDGTKPSNDNNDNPFQTQKMPFEYNSN